MGKSTLMITTKQNDYQCSKSNYLIVVIRTGPNYRYRGPRFRRKKSLPRETSGCPPQCYLSGSFLKHVVLKDLGADDGAWELGRSVAPNKGFNFFVKMAVLNLFVILRTTAKASSHFVVNMPILKRLRKRRM